MGAHNENSYRGLWETINSIEKQTLQPSQVYYLGKIDDASQYLLDLYELQRPGFIKQVDSIEECDIRHKWVQYLRQSWRITKGKLEACIGRYPAIATTGFIAGIHYFRMRPKTELLSRLWIEHGNVELESIIFPPGFEGGLVKWLSLQDWDNVRYVNEQVVKTVESAIAQQHFLNPFSGFYKLMDAYEIDIEYKPKDLFLEQIQHLVAKHPKIAEFKATRLRRS